MLGIIWRLAVRESERATASLGARESQHKHCSLKRDGNHLCLLTESLAELFINSGLSRIQCQLQCQNPKSARLSDACQSSSSLQQINAVRSLYSATPEHTRFSCVVLILAVLSANGILGVENV